MWDLPAPEIKPVSPALAGGLPTTSPPGTFRNVRYYYFFFFQEQHEFYFFFLFYFIYLFIYF